MSGSGRRLKPQRRCRSGPGPVRLGGATRMKGGPSGSAVARPPLGIRDEGQSRRTALPCRGRGSPPPSLGGCPSTADGSPARMAVWRSRPQAAVARGQGVWALSSRRSRPRPPPRHLALTAASLQLEASSQRPAAPLTAMAHKPPQSRRSPQKTWSRRRRRRRRVAPQK